MPPPFCPSLVPRVLQVTYENPTTVVKHGLTNGSSILVADVATGQVLNKVVAWSSDKIDYLSFTTNTNATFSGAGTPGDSKNYYDINRFIFGCYGGTKDGVLVSLGFYVVLAGPLVKSALYGGDKDSSTVSWDDSGSYKGNALPHDFPAC